MDMILLKTRAVDRNSVSRDKADKSRNVMRWQNKNVSQSETEVVGANKLSWVHFIPFAFPYVLRHAQSAVIRRP
jgi:hypothetical protein